MAAHKNTNAIPCPRCQGNHAADAACPGVQHTGIKTGTPSSGPLMAQAESLFESYLAARLVRARRNLTEAKVALLRDPRNRDKRAALFRVAAEAQRLETQLLEQARRAAHARESAPGNQFPRPAASPEPTSAHSSQATEDFRKLQAAKAGVSLISRASAPDGVRAGYRDCPRCGARLTSHASTCGCGHQFAPRQDGIAEPFLSEAELAALRASKFTD